jgi:uncharacterized damage-inducible protein DinB
LPASLPKADQYADLDSLRSALVEQDRSLRAYVDARTAAELARSFDYRDLKGNAHRSVLWETLQHLANHSTYHRGQVTTLLRQSGAKPVSTDFIAFCRERAAQASA